jgi:hypothetical protein
MAGRKSAAAVANVLNAPLNDEAEGWISSLWDDIEVALRSAYRQGMDAARPWIDKVSDLTKQLTVKLGQGAEKVRTVIATRLKTYLQKAIDAALGLVQTSIMVGGKSLAVTSVTIEQKITLSGSLKASLEEIGEFIAEGEISLSAEYGTAK